MNRKKQTFFIILLTILLPNIFISAKTPGFKKAYFLNKLEKEVLEEVNRARTKPRAYSKHLKQFRRFFQGKFICLPGEIRIVTEEGISAVNEAIDYLESKSPVRPLKISKGLSLSAKQLVRDQGPRGITGHYSSDGTSLKDRIKNYGKWDVILGENIGYGEKTARRIIMQFIIDDGVKNRAHRTNMFNPKFKVVGIGYGTHKRYRQMCVLTFAGAFKEKN
jgi:uncharacterized protein YkwD